MKTKIIPNELIEEMSNDDYHAQLGPNEHYYSSSQVKDMLKDPELFHQKYITGELKQESKPQFDIGTYIHTAVLEPHLLEKECAVYQGRRAGKKWEEFQEEHKGKAIITQAEMIKAENAINGLRNSPICMELIEGGTPEISLFLTDFMGLRAKVRFDILSLTKDHSYIADVKSTTGNVKDEWGLRQKVHSFGYDVSAAMYVDMVNLFIKQQNLDVAPVEEFWLLFATKDMPQAKAWCIDEDMLNVGRAKLYKAIGLIKKYVSNGWEFEDEAGYLGPLPWEAQEWLGEEEELEEDEDDL